MLESRLVDNNLPYFFFFLLQLISGVLPLCVYHSGIKDVLDKLKESEEELEQLLHLPVQAGGDYNAANGAHLIKVNIHFIFYYCHNVYKMNTCFNFLYFLFVRFYLKEYLLL